MGDAAKLGGARAYAGYQGGRSSHISFVRNEVLSVMVQVRMLASTAPGGRGVGRRPDRATWVRSTGVRQAETTTVSVIEAIERASQCT